MNKRELAEYRQLLSERDNAEREYKRLLSRREELVNRRVRDENRRSRFVLRLDRDIAEAHERMVMAELKLENAGGAPQ